MQIVPIISERKGGIISVTGDIFLCYSSRVEENFPCKNNRGEYTSGIRYNWCCNLGLQKIKFFLVWG